MSSPPQPPRMNARMTGLASRPTAPSFIGTTAEAMRRADIARKVRERPKESKSHFSTHFPPLCSQCGLVVESCHISEDFENGVYVATIVCHQTEYELRIPAGEVPASSAEALEGMISLAYQERLRALEQEKFTPETLAAMRKTEAESREPSFMEELAAIGAGGDGDG